MPGKRHRERPRITIVGVGRLGTALAIALDRKRYPIEAVVAVHRRSAKTAADLLDAPAVALVAKSLPKYKPTDLVLITTPDDQIDSVVKQLEKLPKKQDRVAIHTSGALSSSVLSALSEEGWHVGSLHPLVSVSDPIAGAESLEGAYWCIEGDQHASKLAKQIVQDLGGQSFSIKSENKALYHAAAVMTSGNLVALFDVALQMLGQCGLTRNDAHSILLPLIESTVSNLSKTDPALALTGTFSRADEATVGRHLRALSSKDLETANELYRLLGRQSVELAISRGVNEQALKRILRMLKS